MAIILFKLDTRTSGLQVEFFALHDIGNTQLEWCHYTYIQHIAPIGEEYLRSTTNYYHMSDLHFPRDHPTDGFMVDQRIGSSHQWHSPNGRYSHRNVPHNPFGTLILRLC